MPVSNRKRQTNRENARKSTGPKTEEGKKNASRNATTHGLFCANLVLEGEDLQTLELLRDQLIDQLRPQNLMERIIVERIVSATWKLERLQRAERVEHGHQAARAVNKAQWRKRRLAGGLEIREMVREQMDEQMDRGVACLQSTLGEERVALPAPTTLAISFGYRYGALERLARYEQQLERSIYRGLRELRELRKPLKDAPELQPSPYGGVMVEDLKKKLRSDCNESEMESLAPWGEGGASDREAASDRDNASGEGTVIDTDDCSSSARENHENEPTRQADEAQAVSDSEVAERCPVELFTPCEVPNAPLANRDNREWRNAPDAGAEQAL